MYVTENNITDSLSYIASNKLLNFEFSTYLSMLLFMRHRFKFEYYLTISLWALSSRREQVAPIVLP